MGALEDAIKTLLDANWDNAIIAKPTYHVPPQFPDNAIARHLYINGKKAKHDDDSNDNSLGQLLTTFIITIYEASESDAEKTTKAVKKVLLNTSVANTEYYFDEMDKLEENRITKVEMEWHQAKLIEDDEI